MLSWSIRASSGTVPVGPSTFSEFISSLPSEDFRIDSDGALKGSGKLAPANHLYAASGTFADFIRDFGGEKPTPVLPKTEKVLEAPKPEQKLLPPQKNRSSSAPIARIILNNSKLMLDPSVINLGKGGSAQLEVDSSVTAAVNFYVRDTSIVKWNSADKKIVAQAEGETEIFIEGGGQLLIAPVKVGSSRELSEFSVPKALMSLGQWGVKNDVFGSPKGFESEVTTGYSKTVPQQEVSSSRIVADRPSVYLSDDDYKTKSIEIQFVDDRSHIALDWVFPVAGISARIVGNSDLVESDISGLAQFDNLPAGGSFLLEFGDPSGRFVRGVTEIRLNGEPSQEVIRVKVLRYKIYDSYSAIFGFVPRSDLASACFMILDSEGSPMKGVELTSSLEDVDGPYYFGKYGANRTSTSTGDSGRVCYFNVEPGFFEINLKEEGTGSYLGTYVSPLVKGHIDLEINVAPVRYRVQPALMTGLEAVIGGLSLEEQIVEDENIINEIEVYAVGENKEMEPSQEFLKSLVYENGVNPSNDRLYGLVQHGYLGDILFSMIRSRMATEGGNVVPLHNRGFMEDLFETVVDMEGVAHFAFDPAMGKLLVDFGHAKSFRAAKPERKATESIEIRAVDQHGVALDGWFWEGRELSRAVFFNLEPGLYSVQVRDENGYWLDMDTTFVDYDTTSYLQLGARINIQ